MTEYKSTLRKGRKPKPGHPWAKWRPKDTARPIAARTELTVRGELSPMVAARWAGLGEYDPKVPWDVYSAMAGERSYLTRHFSRQGEVSLDKRFNDMKVED